MSVQITDEGATIGIVNSGVKKFIQKTGLKFEQRPGTTLRIREINDTNDYLYADITVPTSTDLADLIVQLETFLESGGAPLPSGAATSAKQDAIIAALFENENPLQIDEAPVGTAYIGYASAGSETSAAVWAIKKIVETGADVSVTWADGNKNKDNIWNNRISLSYS